MAKRGRKRKIGARTPSGQLSRVAIAKPNDRVAAHLARFSFVQPTKGPDGRQRNISEDVCDGIGQLHALGLLDCPGHDALDLREVGREYGRLYWRRYGATAPVTVKGEPSPKTTGDALRYTFADARFAELDDALDGFERGAVMSLVCDPWWGDETAPWAQALINEALLARKILPPAGYMPSGNDRALLEAVLRGLVTLATAARKKRAA